MTATMSRQERVEAHRQAAAEREAARRGPGWQVLGHARGVPTFPAPPDPRTVGELLSDDQRQALDAYRDRLGELDGARHAADDTRAAVARAAADDAQAAAEAAAKHKGSAPTSVRPAREAEAAAAARYLMAVANLASADLDAVHDALVPDHRRILATAWSNLADDDAGSV